MYQRVLTDGKVGQWTEIKKIRDVSVRELKIALERGKVYQFAITATNELGESLKQEKENIQQVKAEGSNLNESYFPLSKVYPFLFLGLMPFPSHQYRGIYGWILRLQKPESMWKISLKSQLLFVRQLEAYLLMYEKLFSSAFYYISVNKFI